MVYCILPRKTEDMYTKLLNVIKIKINSRDSISILKNKYFEKSVLEFYNYFGNNYVDHKTETRVQVEPVKRGCRPAGYVPEFVMKDIMTEPIFPIRYWNVYTRVEAGLSRKIKTCR